MPPWLKIAAVLGILVGAVVFALLNTSAGDAFVYSKPLTTVVTNPGEYMDRPLKVEGELRQGSIQFREDPCEWRFVLEEGEHDMPVRFPRCVVPDTFRDGMGITVTVQGQLEGDGRTFLAEEVIPRCPSKYEMQERLQNGESMPHSEGAPTASIGG